MSDAPTGRPAGYEVLRRLGSGRTALVWLARDLAANREVALKLPRPMLQGDAVLRRMFENEVQITLNLDHPHVVRAYAGRSTGRRRLPRARVLRRRHPRPAAAGAGPAAARGRMRLVHEVAMGLAHTHDRRVLHRDVKPANVFLDGDGHAKLGDFGTGTFQSDDIAERVGHRVLHGARGVRGAPHPRAQRRVLAGRAGVRGAERRASVRGATRTTR
jgi:eukaryotic-like serine/threonine-protein kinase